MSTDPPKKPGGMFQKFNQGLSTLKDLTENIERRRQQLHSAPMSNQVHFTHRNNNTSEDALVIEKRPPTPPETHQRQASSKTN